MADDLDYKLIGALGMVRELVFGVMVTKTVLNIPLAQRDTIAFIATTGEASIKQISERFQITSGAATQLVNALEKMDYVIREVNKDDKRVVTVKLSELGAEKFNIIVKAYIERIKKLTAKMSLEEKNQLQESLEKLLIANDINPEPRLLIV